MSRVIDGCEWTKESLDKWLTWLDGDPEWCKCDYGVRSDHTYGKGWVRITTHPKCPEHALCHGYTTAVVAAYKREHPWSTVGPWCPVHKNKGCPTARAIQRPNARRSTKQSDEKAPR